MEVFKDYSKYYNLLYKEKNYKAETEYIEKIINEYSSNAKSILNLGCGTGNHDFIFANKGYEILGVDLSQDMIDIANEKKKVTGNTAVHFKQADIRDLKLNEEFDAVLSLFHVISYQTDNSDLEKTFQTAYKQLKKGGVFIFDCWYGPGVLTDRPTVRDKHFEDEEFKVRRLSTPKMYFSDNYVDVRFNVNILNKLTNKLFEINETHKMRYLFIPELKFFLNQTGFTFERAEEWLTKNELSDKSWNATIVCTK